MNKEQTRLKLVELLLATRPNLSVGVVMLEVEKLIKFIYRDTVLEQFKKNTAHLYEEPTIEEDTLIHEVDSAGTINYGFDPHKVPGDEPVLGEVQIIYMQKGPKSRVVRTLATYKDPKTKEEEAKLLDSVVDRLKSLYYGTVPEQPKPWGGPLEHKQCGFRGDGDSPEDMKSECGPEKQEHNDDKVYSMGLHGSLLEEEDRAPVNQANSGRIATPVTDFKQSNPPLDTKHGLKQAEEEKLAGGYSPIPRLTAEELLKRENGNNGTKA